MGEKQRILTKKHLQKQFKTKEIKLDLGCGNNKKEGFIGVDVADLGGVDVVADFNKKLPFPDNCADEIYSRDCLEHVEKIIGLLKEIIRISKPNTKITFIVPYYTRFSSMTNLFHYHHFNSKTFDSFFEDYPWNYYSDIRFKLISRRINFFWFFKPIEWIVNISDKARNIYEILFPYIFPAKEVVFKMEVIK